MLVLTRKLGEKIVIGGDGGIVVTLLTMGRNQIRIGIEAPKEVVVYRQELAARPRTVEPSISNDLPVCPARQRD